MSLQTFTDLDCWSACREVVDWAYGISSNLPDDEKFGLRQNLNAAARATTRSIAKGHHRPYKESLRYCRISRGALNAVHDDLISAKNAGYITEEAYNEGVEKIDKAARLVGGYIRYLKPLTEKSVAKKIEMQTEQTMAAEP